MCTNQSYIFEIIWQLNPHDATMIFCPIAGFCFSSLINPNDTFQRGSVFLSYLASKLCKKIYIWIGFRVAEWKRFCPIRQRF